MTINKNQNEEKFNEWHSNPSNWKLGLFYFNIEDKRIFPPKRTRLGWTINFANPTSIIIMLLIIIVLFFVPKYLKFN